MDNKNTVSLKNLNPFKILSEEGFKKVVETFGKGILFPNGSVNRKELGKIVFSNRL